MEEAMEVKRQLERFHKEHDEILRFLVFAEEALKRAASEDREIRCQGLGELQELEGKLTEIREHCREEEENLESPFRLYLDDAALADLEEEHALLERLTDSFRTELKLAAMPRTLELVRLGQQLLDHIRHHIAYEEGLLKQIKDGTEAEENLFLRYTQGAE
jgi:hypothetical protein